MILVRPSFEILSIMGVGITDLAEKSLRLIEEAGRTCYKSGSPLTSESSKKFVKKLNDLGHESVLEHSAMSVKLIIDRGVSHELVRHRLCAFSQESTRYCNYKGEVTFIIPPWCTDLGVGEYELPTNEILNPFTMEWLWAMQDAEDHYITLLQKWTPQQARSVLPNSLKTEIVVTANFREWKHIFKLRCAKAAHPQMREVMIPLCEECKKLIPVIFDGIVY